MYKLIDFLVKQREERITFAKKQADEIGEYVKRKKATTDKTVENMLIINEALNAQNIMLERCIKEAREEKTSVSDESLRYLLTSC